MEADAVTILHDDGGGRIPLATLPADLQATFHYDSAAAHAAADSFRKEEAESQQTEAQERGAAAPPFDAALSNYADAVEEAKNNKKLLLLHFTGSDWCPYCQELDREVLTTSSFQNFLLPTLSL